MRGSNASGKFQNPFVNRRFFGKNINGQSGYFAVFQPFNDSVVIYDQSPAAIDNINSVFAKRERISVEHVFSQISHGNMKRDHITFFEKLFISYMSDIFRKPGIWFTNHNMHSNAFGQPVNFPADITKSDNS